MTTLVTEMSPSKMEITSKGKHPAIQTSKPRSTGDGAMLKMDDASDISVVRHVLVNRHQYTRNQRQESHPTCLIPHRLTSMNLEQPPGHVSVAFQLDREG
jgi:hypothetical protein